MSGGEDESVTVRPERIGRVVAEVFGVQGIGQRGERHWRARVARLGGLNGVHRERADGIDREELKLGVRGVGHGSYPRCVLRRRAHGGGARVRGCAVRHEAES